MLEGQKDLVEGWLTRLRRRPLIAAGILAATILGGIVSFLEITDKIVDRTAKSFKRPAVIALSLSPNAAGFKEGRETSLRDNTTTIRSFEPSYPFALEPRMILLTTIDNPSEKDLIITAATYVVEETDAVKGGPSGPLDGLATYLHEIAHEKGEQPKALIPPFRVASQSAASLELELVSSTPGWGLGWQMHIRLESNLGDAMTETFLLYLPKKAEHSQTGKHSRSGTVAKEKAVNHDILLERVDVGLPDPRYSQCIYTKAGVLNNIQHLDALDRDVMFLRAGSSPIDEFAKKETGTAPPVQYGQMLSRNKMEMLLRLIKSQAPCEP